jgi:hypothetical protein
MDILCPHHYFLFEVSKKGKLIVKQIMACLMMEKLKCTAS